MISQTKHHISFEDQKFDTIICLNGDLPDKVFFSMLPDTTIIAADGAANVLMAKGILPTYLVGDLDSVGKDVLQILESESKVIHKREQETNDFEKCLVFSKNLDSKNILIVGMNGGHLEHTLNNWSVFAKFAHKMNLTIFENNRYGISIHSSAKISTKKGETISLIPQIKTKLTTKNLYWNLNNEVIEFASREGARNKATSTSIEIIIHRGSLLMFCDSRLPYSPIFTES